MVENVNFDELFNNSYELDIKENNVLDNIMSNVDINGNIIDNEVVNLTNCALIMVDFIGEEKFKDTQKITFYECQGFCCRKVGEVSDCDDDYSISLKMGSYVVKTDNLDDFKFSINDYKDTYKLTLDYTSNKIMMDKINNVD